MTYEGKNEKPYAGKTRYDLGNNPIVGVPIIPGQIELKVLEKELETLSGLARLSREAHTESFVEENPEVKRRYTGSIGTKRSSNWYGSLEPMHPFMVQRLDNP